MATTTSISNCTFIKENSMKQLSCLTVYPGLQKLRLEFSDNSWPIIQTYDNWRTTVKVIAELREQYDDYLVKDVLTGLSYRTGRNVK